MENLFYAPPENFADQISVQISGQEAIHISKVLRHDIGDAIHVADGRGNIFHCEIANLTKQSVIANVIDISTNKPPAIKKVLGFGAIKKRDRLEFAVEKAVELDAWEICVFNADHSERSKINQDRLQTIVISAFKQSKRRWLPHLTFLNSLDEVFTHYKNFHAVLAHVASDVKQPRELKDEHNILLVGPEGGFSEREIELAEAKNAEFISLGQNRLRAETAALAMMSQYLFTT